MPGMRDDEGRMNRLLKAEEALGLLTAQLQAQHLISTAILQDAVTLDLQPDDGGTGTPPACSSYTLACVVAASCSHLLDAPTYAATLTDSAAAVLDTWTATPGVVHPVTVAGPDTYTLSVEVDNANRPAATFTGAINLLPSQCGATLAVQTCYTTSLGLGPVRGCNGLPLEGATVEVTGDEEATYVTDADGYVIEPYTGAADSPALTFAVSAAGFETRSLTSIADPCCHASPASDPAPGGVQLTPDADHVCGCDPTCPWPVKRVLYVTDAKGSCDLTYGTVGGLAGWWGEHTYSEPEGGESVAVYDPYTAVWRTCCVKKEVAVTVRYRLHCDGGQYRLSRNLVGMCFNLEGSFCASAPGGRVGPRLTGGGSVVGWLSDDTYLPTCGGAFSHSFGFTTPDPYPSEALTGPAEVTE